MIRVDKFLCDMNIGSRSQVKDAIKKGQVQVNGMVIKKPEMKINEQEDHVTFQGKELSYQKFYYFMFHKPAGCITATEDKTQETVLDYMKGVECKDLFPVGRLDKDTEGLLLITNDGELAHKMLSPKYHVTKKYFVKLLKELSIKEKEELEKGVDIGEKSITRPAVIDMVTDTSCYISITEGKFHQIKRMFEAVDNQVIYLKRVTFGNLKLDETIQKGEFRPLTEEEIEQINIF